MIARIYDLACQPRQTFLKIKKQLHHSFAEPHRLRAWWFYFCHPQWPLFTPDTTSYLRTYLKPDMQIFEWGAGRSTPFFAAFAGQVISIEHDSRWHQKVRRDLFRQGHKNVALKLIKPSNLKQSLQIAALPPLLEHQEFFSYVQTILEYPDNFFDVVAVDGRERASCALIALAKVKPGGILLLDDSQRERYAPAMTEIAKQDWEARHFPYGFNRTTIWTKPT